MMKLHWSWQWNRRFALIQAHKHTRYKEKKMECEEIGTIFLYRSNRAAESTL